MTLLGVDIGGTKIAVAREGAASRRAATPRGPDAIIATVVQLVRAAAHGATITGVGVGSAGTFDDEGTVVLATELIPEWTGTRLADLLREALKVPVVAINDVHAAALAEANSGAARGVDRVLVAATGTGLGGAFTRHGVVDRGEHGTAGALGHIPVPGLTRRCSCGRFGHAEAYASGPGMERTFRESVGRVLALADIGILAAGDDPDAMAAVASGGRALGSALAVAATLLDPDIIVVAGGAAGLGRLLLDPTIEAYRGEVLAPLAEVPIVPAALGADAAIIGAIGAIRAHLA